MIAYTLKEEFVHTEPEEMPEQPAREIDWDKGLASKRVSRTMFLLRVLLGVLLAADLFYVTSKWIQDPSRRNTAWLVVILVLNAAAVKWYLNKRKVSNSKTKSRKIIEKERPLYLDPVLLATFLLMVGALAWSGYFYPRSEQRKNEALRATETSLAELLPPKPTPVTSEQYNARDADLRKNPTPQNPATAPKAEASAPASRTAAEVGTPTTTAEAPAPPKAPRPAPIVASVITDPTTVRVIQPQAAQAKATDEQLPPLPRQPDGKIMGNEELSNNVRNLHVRVGTVEGKVATLEKVRIKLADSPTLEQYVLPNGKFESPHISKPKPLNWQPKKLSGGS